MPSATGFGATIDADGTTLVCLSYFGAGSRTAHVRYLIRRLKRLLPQARFIACFWMLGDEPERLEEWRSSVGADCAATSLEQVTTICSQEVGAQRLGIAA